MLARHVILRPKSCRRGVPEPRVLFWPVRLSLNLDYATRFMSSQTQLESVINGLRRSRVFTRKFLVGLTPEEWFWSPPSFTTHIAWQVAHVAVAQYSLCLRRVRGRTVEDESLIPDAFIEAYTLGSQPQPGAENNLPIEEIRGVLDAVQEQVLAELPTFTEAAMDVALEQPHPIFKTKLDAIEWAPQHELVHAGQIAMLRRLMGKPPLR